MQLSTRCNWMIFGGEKPIAYRKSVICLKSNFISYSCMEYTSPFVGIKLTTLVVIGTSCRYRCKPTYSIVTAMTAHFFIWLNKYRLQCKLKKYWYLYIFIYNWKKICSNTFYLSIFSLKPTKFLHPHYHNILYQRDYHH
jgi:hypothetical protein